jgi:transcription elongation factor Elf1
MSDVIQFSCPQCQGEKFKATREVKSLADFDGAVCANCGTTISEDDVKNQAVTIARKSITDALKRSLK